MGLRNAIGSSLVRVGKAFTGSAETPASVPAQMQQAAAGTSYMGFEHTFAPGFPIGPYDGYQRHPRQQDFTTGYNIATRPRSYERVSFDTLKGLITNYDVAGIVIRHRIDSLRSLDWKLVACEGYTGDVKDAIGTGMAALRKPDRENYFDAWLAKWLRDVLSYDAGCLYRLRSRAGNCVGLMCVDGTTVAPLLDYWGQRPAPPAEAYVQYIQGLPWNWLTQDDLIYQPMWGTNDSPYGHAPIEDVILNANTDIRFQLYFLQRFTEGNLPAAFASAPETWTPQQIEQFQEYWDSFVYGDQSRKHQIRWIPGGSSFAWSDEKEFTDHFSLFLMRKTCASFAVVPSDLGFTESVNRSSGESQADVQHRVGDLPLIRYTQRILDSFLQDDLRLPLRFQFDLGEEQADRVQQAQADKLYVDMGAISASKIGEMRYGTADPQTIPRFINSTRGGPIPLASLFAVAGEIDQATGLPAEGAELPRKVFGGVEGVLPNPPIRVMSLAEQEFGPQAMPPAPPPQPKMTDGDAGPLPLPAAAVAKDGEGAGITAATGTYGDPLLRGNAPDENDDEEARAESAAVAKEMARFRSHERTCKRRGEWRDFDFVHVPAGRARRLNASARRTVRKAPPPADFGPPAAPQTVYRQLLGNYEPEGIAWVLGCAWRGPAGIPPGMVNTSSEDSWAASEPGANAEHVARFEAEIKAGGDVNPVVLVKVPGRDKLEIVDGHHRYKAYTALGRPVKAYTGFPADDRWQETHSFQQHSGGDPLNKSAADGGALCFLLIRAPNADGKQRYLLQKRGEESPHPGTWGLPGGHARTGEDLWQAAVREAAEELGPLPPLERGPALARTQGAQAVHTFLVQLDRMFTPDMAAAATPGESSGWGWFSRRQVAGLDLHPAMRETWGQLCAAGLAGAGADWAPVSKTVTGGDLSPREGMISLDLPDGLIPPVPGGVTGHHVTVAYLGPDVDDAAFSQACARARDAAAAMPGPLSGSVSGIGCFPPPESGGGKIPVWAAAAIPGAEALREALADLPASGHANWVPHVTLAYADQGDPLPAPLPETPVTFTHLSVHRGGDVQRFPLGPASADSSQAAEAVEKAGKQGGLKARDWPGWKLDLATAAHWAPKVTAAAQKALPKARLREIAAAYIAAHPDQDGNAAGKRQRNEAAAAWLASWLASRGAAVDMAGPAEGIAADGAMIGAASARAALGGQADAATGGWQPGNTTAARGILGSLGQDGLLAQASGGGGSAASGLASGMAGGYIDVVARVLAGWDPDVAADELAAMLEDAVADGAYAEALTVTQITTVSGQAALQYYLANTQSLLSWYAIIDGRTCPACLANAAAEPRKAGETWPSGDVAPPAHPGGCRCALGPADLP